MERITKEELLEMLFHDDYEHLKGKKLRMTREGLGELLEYLQDDAPSLTLEQAMFKQSLGLNEWDPLPEGVTYPEGIK